MGTHDGLLTTVKGALVVGMFVTLYVVAGTATQV